MPVTVLPFFLRNALESGLSRALSIAVNLYRIRDEDRRSTEEITVENSSSSLFNSLNMICKDMPKDN